MKKFFTVIGITFLGIVLLLNIFLTANLDASEHITINFNSFFYILGLAIVNLIIYFLTSKLNKFLYKDEKRKKLRISLFIIVIGIYILASILWFIFVKPPIVGDQIHVVSMGQLFERGYDEEILNSMTYAGIPLDEYIQAYNQQVPQAFLYSLFFRIINNDGYSTPRIINIISILIIVLAIYKIGNMISKEHKINKVLLLTLLLTFISLPMLLTFVYGDIPSLACSLISVYSFMKFTDTKKLRYALIGTIASMIAYMFRMNSLIFVIATIIYLLFNLFTKIKSKTLKENIINFLVIIIYILVSILPAQIVDNYYINKYGLDKSKEYPSISYIYMGMSESWRGNGWYNEDIGEPALKNPIEIKEIYKKNIIERLLYFSKNIGYTFRFYTMKLASMWAENTYSAIRLNLLNESEDDYLNKIKAPLTFYQKALLILSCICAIIVLIQNRKNISTNVIYLLLIFMGGFAFHIIWEAKSRYIIPYIIVLIPIASIQINKIIEKKKRIEGVKKEV